MLRPLCGWRLAGAPSRCRGLASPASHPAGTPCVGAGRQQTRRKFGSTHVRLAAAQELDSECVLSTVTYNNNDDATCTRVDIEVSDFPGLLRVISWVLVGMEVRVERAELRTIDRLAINTLWLQAAHSARKLSDKEAEAVCSRLGDHLDVCAPRALSDTDCVACSVMGVHVSVDGESTTVKLDAVLDTSHLLLDVSSVFSAMELDVSAAHKEKGSWTFTLKGPRLSAGIMKSLALLLSNQVGKPGMRATQLLEVPV